MTVLQNIAIEIKKKSACEISQALFFFYFNRDFSA